MSAPESPRSVIGEIRQTITAGIADGLPAPAEVTPDLNYTATVAYSTYDDLLAWIDSGRVNPCGELELLGGVLAGDVIFGDTAPGGWYITVTAPLPSDQEAGDRS